MPFVIPRDILKPTAVCLQTDCLETVLARFQGEHLEELVVLDERRAPVGVITLKSLWPYGTGDRSLADLRQKSLQELEADLVAQTGMGLAIPLVQPLTPLNIHSDLATLEADCRATAPPWAAVDETGQFVGLLDAIQIWKFFADQAQSAQETVIQVSTPPSWFPGHGSAGLSRPMENREREDSLEVNFWGQENGGDAHDAVGVKTEGRTPVSSEGNPDWAVSPLHPTQVPSSLLWETFSLLSSVEIVRRLPLPLMLQTGRGQIIVQNAAWQQRLGELQNPVEVWQSAAPLLEQVPVVAGDRNGICQLGADVNSCDCTCEVKGGGERVWRFVKIPFGLLTAGASDVAAMVRPVSGSYRNLHRVLHSVFHLAHLNTAVSTLPPVGDRAETLWLILAQDATEQYRMDQELAAKNADLVQLNRLKDEFLACISHELKTPLTAILGLSSLLKDQMIGDLNPRQLRYAHLIYQSGRHLMTIVNDILDLARIETGQLELALELVSVASVCDRAYAQARQQVTNRDSDSDSPPAGQADAPPPLPAFTLEIQPGLETLIADEMRLRQMLSNLLSNALKFTPETGTIGLQVESWGSWVAFTVWDTGIGIPADKQHLIFQKFQQLESPLTRQFEGTGLGLVLTQRLARLHGGDVTFTSAEGKGSQFTILLPPLPANQVMSLEPDQLSPMPILPRTNAHGLILVVESAPQLLDPLTSKLTNLGYKVAIARSGTEALEKARCLQPNLTLLNPTLPLLSGWDVLTLLKRDPSTAHIPTVVMTTPTAQQITQHPDADGFLNLPLQDGPLSALLERFRGEQSPPASPKACCHVTILHLYGTDHPIPEEESDPSTAPELQELLAPLPCHILEVNGIEQADLLARVWKPHVILLSRAIAHPESLLQQLSQSSKLQRLPLITLTHDSTQAANQFPHLNVYPCLMPLAASASGHLSALSQVIQVATGIHWIPQVLVIDLAKQVETEVLAELTRHLDGLDCQAMVTHSWIDTAQHLRSQTLDLMVLCVPHLRAQPDLIRILHVLEHLELRPPLVVWPCPTATNPEGRSPQFAQISSETQSLLQRLEQVSTCILSPTATVEHLMDQICETLGRTLDLE
jgi:signal transduction histidine kinase